MDNIVATSNQEESQGAYNYQEKDKLVTPTIQKEQPLEIYKKEHNTSYLNDLLQVDDLLPDTFRDDIGRIDEYITNLMSQEGYKLTTEAYKSMFGAVKRNLGINDDMTLESTVNRLSKYIDAEDLIRAVGGEDTQKLVKALKKVPTDQLNKFVMREIEKRVIK